MITPMRNSRNRNSTIGFRDNLLAILEVKCCRAEMTAMLRLYGLGFVDFRDALTGGDCEEFFGGALVGLAVDCGGDDLDFGNSEGGCALSIP